jgi:hypothetical protein
MDHPDTVGVEFDPVDHHVGQPYQQRRIVVHARSSS